MELKNYWIIKGDNVDTEGSYGESLDSVRETIINDSDRLSQAESVTLMYEDGFELPLDGEALVRFNGQLREEFEDRMERLSWGGEPERNSYNSCF